MEFFDKELKVRLTFIEEVLGSSPASKEVYRDYIASKAPEAPSIEDEIEAVGIDETADSKMTVFPRVDGKVGVWDYQISGVLVPEVRGMSEGGSGSRETGMRAHPPTRLERNTERGQNHRSRQGDSDGNGEAGRCDGSCKAADDCCREKRAAKRNFENFGRKMKWRNTKAGYIQTGRLMLTLTRRKSLIL
ncbi:MAG: hypothetical protein ACI3ZQ_05960 [Candidatus Cryptobacteroides sp.]